MKELRLVDRKSNRPVLLIVLDIIEDIKTDKVKEVSDEETH